MVLFLHSRYRTTGGEERVVEDLAWIVRERLGEHVELLERDSNGVGRLEAAAGLLRGGVGPDEVARALRLGRPRVLHAHNLHPTFGWRALAAARRAGVRVVLHLHQYRLVCAIGVCYTRGEDCVRCHGRNTLPGIRLNCRRSVAEAVLYGAGLALWQRRLVDQADAVIVPSAFARERLRELGAPLPWQRVRVLAPPLRALEAPVERPAATAAGDYALVVSRLAPEKGVDVAIEACRRARMPLIVAGDGPEEETLRAVARGADVRFLGRVSGRDLPALRAGAAIALVPSRSAETFALAAAEAMAAGMPVAASDVGALGELLGPSALVPAGDPDALAAAISRLANDEAAGRENRRRVGELCSGDSVAAALAEVYGGRERITRSA